MPRTTPPDHGPTPFGEWITVHAGGSTHNELTLALADVVRAVMDQGKKGSVKLEVKIAPAGSGRRTVTTSCRVTPVLPAPEGELSIFWPDEVGGLHRSDPYQGTLDDVQTPAGPKGEPQQLPPPPA